MLTFTLGIWFVEAGMAPTSINLNINIRLRRNALNLCLLILMLIGCNACSAPGQYIETTGRFAWATATLADASTAYLDQVNYINFDTELVTAKYNKVPISKQTLQDPFFSEKDMAARRAMLATIRAYAASLAKVSNDNLGEAFRTEVLGLKDDVLVLQRHLQAASSETKLKQLESNVGFVSSVFGGIGGMIIEQMQSDAIAEAILQADPAMRGAADLLARDIQLITLKMQNARDIQFAIAVDGVNSALERASIEERLKLVEGVRPFANQVVASKAIGTDFAAALESYRKAQAEMTAYAKTKKPEPLADLAAAVDVFAERAGFLLSLIRSHIK